MRSRLVLNKLPVPTWRWLKVNHTVLENLDLPGITPYRKDPIKMAPKNGLDLQIQPKNLYFMDSMGNFPQGGPKGVSDEMVDFVQNHHNTGVLLQIQEGAHLKSPIWLTFAHDGDHRSIIDHNLIIAQANSHSTLIMDYSSEDATPGFHNGYTRVFAKEGASIHVIRIQNMNDSSISLDSTISTLGRDARVTMTTIELGAQNRVSSMVSHLEGENALSNMDSVYLTDGHRQLDMNYYMFHHARRSQSNINVQGAMMDRSKKIFKGTLDFKRGASLSKGSEEEYAILLDPEVVCQSIPLLLCEEDDVQGQHAASAGRIDEDQLFYLMSRGLSHGEARRIIIESAFEPILKGIPLAHLKDQVKANINHRLMQDREG